MSMIDAALFYAKRGWRVLPLKPKSKEPLIKDWPTRATTNEEQIHEWWGKWPDANIGIAMGEETGLVAIDLDGAEGERSWTQLYEEVPDMPEETLESKTANGRHLIGQYPKHREVRNKINARPGLDIRGEGGYIVAPPSMHPSGVIYDWPYDFETEPQEFPKKLFDVLLGPKQAAPEPQPKTKVQRSGESPLPQAKEPPAPASPQPPQAPQDASSVVERARLYLLEAEPAVQGQGGHNALLWAARALVVGFELSDAEARSLLEQYNQRCSPPWDLADPAQAKDFYRKLDEARNTPAEKPSGWLLDEYGLRSGDEALAALGDRVAEALLASAARKEEGAIVAETPETSALANLPRDPFPLHCFPEKLQQYFGVMSKALQVQPMTLAGPAMAVAGSAIGNTNILRIHEDFEVRGTLWVLVIGESGSNKTAPFQKIIDPMQTPIPMEAMQDTMTGTMSIQSQYWIDDATTSSVISLIQHCPRGLLLANHEATTWIGAFDLYTLGKGGKKKVSVDEGIWLKAYDSMPYQLNRKTDQEAVFIPCFTVGVCGVTQPQQFNKCIDPSNFASGLIPRLFIIRMERRRRKLFNLPIDEDVRRVWGDVVLYLRLLTFAEIGTGFQGNEPHVITLNHAAYTQFHAEYERLEDKRMSTPDGSIAGMFYSKAEGATARIALVLHGMEAGCGEHGMLERVNEQTMCKAIELQRWFLEEQLRVYGLADDRQTRQVVAKLKEDLEKCANADGVGRVRDVQRRRKASSVEPLRDQIHKLAEAGFVEWLSRQRKTYRLLEGKWDGKS